MSDTATPTGSLDLWVEPGPPVGDVPLVLTHRFGPFGPELGVPLLLLPAVEISGSVQGLRQTGFGVAELHHGRQPVLTHEIPETAGLSITLQCYQCLCLIVC